MKALVPFFPINPWETLEYEGTCSLVVSNPWETLENEGFCSLVSQSLLRDFRK